MRIPRKNIRDFCGKPIISYSIEAALRSGCFERIVVSTDDDEIASVARKWGAETPFVRPAELANDFAGTIPVVKHAIEWFREQGEAPEYTCCIYATAPLIRPEDLIRGFKILQNSGGDYAFTVARYPFPIQRAVRLAASGRLTMFNPECFGTRSQDLEEAYHDAGQFYWGRSDAYLREVPMFSEASAPILLPHHRVQDIDTYEDWHMAELMYRLLQQEEAT